MVITTSLYRRVESNQSWEHLNPLHSVPPVRIIVVITIRPTLVLPQ